MAFGFEGEEFLKDRRAPSFPKPWVSSSPKSKASRQQEKLFCFHSWYRLPSVLYLFSFMTARQSIEDKLMHMHQKPESQLLGFSTALTFDLRPVVETVSVWKTRQGMLDFHACPEHSKAMTKFGKGTPIRMQSGFRELRISSSEVPKHGNALDTMHLFGRIKRGEMIPFDSKA